MFRSSAKVHATKSSRIFFVTNAPDPPHWSLKSCFWCISYHLDAFGTVRLPYETRDKMGRTFKSLCHEVATEFITTNAPDPPHWTLNSCFGAFHTIWVHLGPLGCLTKLGEKRAEIMQKFVPRSCFRIFRREPTRSTPLDPKHIFWSISYHLGAFATIW